MTIRHALTAALVACVLLTGCGSRGTSPKLQPDDVEVMSITVMKHLDSQRPDRKPDYLGKVEAVSENTVTLALAEIPAGIFLSPGERAQAKAQQQAGSQAPPEGGRQKMTLKLTGKTKDILFASNTKIVRFYKDAGHPCLQSLELKEIEKGNVLTVWMQDNHAVYVQVSRRKV